jgi:hypothetical protein
MTFFKVSPVSVHSLESGSSQQYSFGEESKQPVSTARENTMTIIAPRNPDLLLLGMKDLLCVGLPGKHFLQWEYMKKDHGRNAFRSCFS